MSSEDVKVAIREHLENNGYILESVQFKSEPVINRFGQDMGVTKFTEAICEVSGIPPKRKPSDEFRGMLNPYPDK